MAGSVSHRPRGLRARSGAGLMNFLFAVAELYGLFIFGIVMMAVFMGAAKE